MIKQSDLRIGNYVVVFNWKVVQIKSIADMDQYIQFDPIKLTKEWHLNFGAKELSPGEFTYEFNGKKYCTIIPNGNQNADTEDEAESSWASHVHMWQNKFYFDYGIELTTQNEIH